MADTKVPYDPRSPGLLCFHEAAAKFVSGAESPLTFWERCAERIAVREPTVHAFAHTMLESARESAEAATRRYKDNRPLSPIDGLPIAVKDIFETRDAPTAWGVNAFASHPPFRDAAVVRALRVSGAVIAGKTRLPELGFGAPPATANPWNPARSPGGSSSGSAAVVGAGMLPVAIGTQGRGSLTRPASYCGVYGYKPTHGAIHRGGDGGGQETNTHVGVLAGSLADAWIVARQLSEEAGPHPGSFGLEGPFDLPDARKPSRLVRLDGPGWKQTDPGPRAAYEALIAAIARAGIPVDEASASPDTKAVSDELENASVALADIADYESRWPLVMYLQRARETGADLVSPVALKKGLVRADIPRVRYHDALRFRAAFQAKLEACRRDGVLFISPSATDAAPADRNSTGSSVYQWASSVAGNPVVSLPFMVTDGLPFGLQVQGFRGHDAALIANCRWLDEAFRRGAF